MKSLCNPILAKKETAWIGLEVDNLLEQLNGVAYKRIEFDVVCHNSRNLNNDETFR